MLSMSVVRNPGKERPNVNKLEALEPMLVPIGGTVIDLLGRCKVEDFREFGTTHSTWSADRDNPEKLAAIRAHLEVITKTVDSVRSKAVLRAWLEARDIPCFEGEKLRMLQLSVTIAMHAICLPRTFINARVDEECECIDCSIAGEATH